MAEPVRPIRLNLDPEPGHPALRPLEASNERPRRMLGPGLARPAVEPLGEGARRVFGFTKAGELELSAPDWLIRGLIERDTLLSLSGPPGAGKSFMGLGWCLHVAAGLDWFGHRVTQGPVLYVCGEGSRGVTRRLRALELDTAKRLQDVPLYVSNGAAGLTDPHQLAAVLRAVDRVVSEVGKPVLIVLDTVARNFGPGDENSTEDMRGFVAACDRLREETGACIVLVHHTGHGDKTRGRGSSVLPGAVDSDLILSVDEGRVIRLESNKVKDGEPLAGLAFRLERVDLGTFDDEGEPITSAVLRYLPDAPMVAKGKRAQGKNQVQALTLLQQEYARRRANVEASGRPASAALVELERWALLCEGEGMPRKRWREARDGLEAAGSIRVDPPHVLIASDTATEVEL